MPESIIAPLEKMYSEEYAPIISENGGVTAIDHDDILVYYANLEDIGTGIIADASPKQKTNALTEVSTLMLQATTELQKAHEEHRIVPPLTEGEATKLLGKYSTLKAILEMAETKTPKTKRPSNTDNIDTDKPKR